MSDNVQSASAPTAPPTFMQKFGKWVYAVSAFIIAAIGVLKFADNFSLPSCTADRTKSTIESIFKGKDVELTSVTNMQPVTDTSSEKTCTARIESKDETANIDYKISWSGWTAQVLIATVRDEKGK
jgi:hypothetical protein